jgi:hypothetical protein
MSTTKHRIIRFSIHLRKRWFFGTYLFLASKPQYYFFVPETLAYIICVLCKNRRECLLGETICTISNVSNVSLEDVFPRFLRFNGKRTSRLHNVNDVSRSRGFSIRRLRCVRYYRLACVRLRCVLPHKGHSRLFFG